MEDRIEQYGKAMAALDIEALAELRHPEYQCYYPQSGERFRSHDAWAAAHRNYPERLGELDWESETVKGGERKAEVVRTTSPGFLLPTPIVQISDTADLAIIEGKGDWPDGKTYHWVQILEFKDHLVWRETQYFAEPFDAPDWRAPYVELDPA